MTAPARRGPDGRDADVRALQAALAAENAAVWGYGAAGGRLAGSRQQTARRDWYSHQAARDALTAKLTALGATPAPAAANYRLPFPVRSAHAAVALAVYLEEHVVTAYLGLVALSDQGLRRYGARHMQAAALRAASWRGATVAFPGLRSAGGAGPSASSSPPTGR